MKAYVISLSAVDKRRAPVKKQLEHEENIEYEFIPAIDGNALSVTEKKNCLILRKPRSGMDVTYEQVKSDVR